jgi:hypothetical protein
VTATIVGPDGQPLVINQPLESQLQRITAAPGTVVQVIFRGPRPISVLASLLSANGESLLNILRLPADNVTLYNLPTASGTYLLGIEVTFPGGSATYFFRVALAG